MPAIVTRCAQVRRGFTVPSSRFEPATVRGRCRRSRAHARRGGSLAWADMTGATLAPVAGDVTSADDQGRTTTFVPMYAQFHIQIASGIDWRTQPPDSGVPSWETDWTRRPVSVSKGIS